MHKGRRRASEDVLVVMATQLSSKTEQMRRWHVIPSHARILARPSWGTQSCFSGSSHFFSFFLSNSPPSSSSSSPAACLLENLFSCSLALYLPIFPPSRLSPSSSSLLHFAQRLQLNHVSAFTSCNWFSFSFFDIRRKTQQSKVIVLVLYNCKEMWKLLKWNVLYVLSPKPDKSYSSKPCSFIALYIVYHFYHLSFTC